MKRNCLILSVLFLIAFFINVDAQVFSSEKIVSLAKSYVESNQWEDIYLHVDRDKIIAGEDMWFSIFSTDRSSGKLTSGNSVVYVELINTWNSPIIQKRFEISGGRGNGNFLIPDSVCSGTYTVRAYTNQMKNYFPENCFIHDIEIFNPFRNTSYRSKIPADSMEKTISISFFPEGGSFINGIETNVVAKCVNHSGRGVSLTGTITDDAGNFIASFQSDRFGFGNIKIIPKSNVKYSLTTSYGSFPLPVANENGLSLNVENSISGSINILLTAAGAYLQSSSKKFFLVIRNNGNLYSIPDIKINDRFTKITVPESELSGSINQLVLISEEGDILAKRLFYSPQKYSTSLIVTSDTVFGKREKVQFKINSSDDLGIVANNLSITVIPYNLTSQSDIEDYIVFGTEFGILPWENSEYHLSDIDNKLIDNFLICSDSRWINWEAILSGSKNKIMYPPEKDIHFLSVRLRYRDSNKSDSIKMLYLSAIHNKNADFNYAMRNSDDRFSFMLPIDTSLRNLIIQPEVANNNISLEVEPSYSLMMPDFHYYSINTPEPILDIFSGLSFNYQVSKIYNSIYKKESDTLISSYHKTPRFYGIPEVVIRMNDFILLPVMQEVFFELIPGVTFKNSKAGWKIKMINPLTAEYYDDSPLVLIDGIVLHDLSVLANLDPELVDRIEVVKTPYQINNLRINGIVNVITRSGNITNSSIPDYAAQLSYRVIEKTPVFISLDYSDKKLKESRIPDLRNTLYWNPSFTFNGNKSDLCEFWTSDLPGSYIINIEGIMSDGKPISIHKHFIVK
jgi:hypothetical protein